MSTDAYWKKRAEDMPHFTPAHTDQQNIQLPNVPQPPNGGEIDLTARLQQRLQQQPQMNPPVQNRDMPHYSGPTANVCMVRENITAYRQVQSQSFGSTTPLVIGIGPLNGVAGKQFENKGLVSCYLVDNMQTIDLAEMSEHPERMIRLVQISAPFIGTLLVPESAIVSSTSNQGAQILRG